MVSTQLHLILGKGGVGRSTFAAALAMKLARECKDPILLIEIQGSGRALQLCGATAEPSYSISPLGTANLWGCRILPRDAFKEYFNVILSLGNTESSFAGITSALRDRVVEKVSENKVVSAFIDVCPGLEPVVLLGKVFWEAEKGRPAESNRQWGHIVVDAPATGHGIALFQSTQAVIDVFHGTGPIAKQAREIMTLIQSSERTKIHLVTLPEELPIRESIELTAQLKSLKLIPYEIVMNRRSPEMIVGQQFSKSSQRSDPWTQTIELEQENEQEQKRLVEELKKALPDFKITSLPDVLESDPKKIAEILSLEGAL